MPDKTKHTLEEVLDAFDKGHTMVGAAHRLGCSFGTIYNYRKRWKAVDDAIKMHRRELVDIGETGLRGALLKAEPWAIAFTLKTLGKDEGYVERSVQVHQGDDDKPIHVDVRPDLSQLSVSELETLANLARKTARPTND